MRLYVEHKKGRHKVDLFLLSVWLIRRLLWCHH
ncbi:hypothetical protein EIB96_17060 [Vibrio parahaemolyticus]|nr:hypothetical protein [Vibrio parahaemolyticus]EGQ8142185.1 hypothetical protein [Vibrio parahaemolyticus]EGQ8157289.1 hypothetical protein [Vibrio parahaemolyticus]EGQ8162490.1 hypothetical protein [Vibrio parahaemolyticus]EGQ8180512.1 hypothetical protein [Vibrio parahaemolyticus]